MIDYPKVHDNHEVENLAQVMQMVKLVFVPKLRDAIQLVVDMVSLQLVVELGLLVFY
jgi:hypothetical protein